MDIAVVQAALSDFSTFVKNITDLFQGVPEVFINLGNWFADQSVEVDDGVATLKPDTDETIGIVDAWTETTKIFGGSSEE